MGKTYVSAVKYVIRMEFEINGIVDKPDIIGAIFGQSEGLLGNEMDLKELQQNGRIGRIDIKQSSRMGKTNGEITVPSSMDMVETSILAAAIEAVDKVGPCEAKFKTKEIEDTRNLKRKEITERAKDILQKFMQDKMPESQELAEEVRTKIRTAKIESYGPDKLPCGPAIFEDDAIILVEGRADVINLLRNSIKNVIGIGGSKIPISIVDFTKKKTVTMFIDGDRGGELNVRKLKQMGGKIDFIARAPDGKEVEELCRKEIVMALRKKVSAAQADAVELARQAMNEAQAEGELESGLAEVASEVSEAPVQRIQSPFKPAGFERPRGGRGFGESGFGPRPRGGFGKGFGRSSERPRRTGFAPRSTGFGSGFGERGFGLREIDREERAAEAVAQAPKEVVGEEAKQFAPILEELRGSLKARLLSESFSIIAEVPVRELLVAMKNNSGTNAVVFDGIITQKVVETAKEKGVKFVIGIKKGKIREEKEVKAWALGP